MASKKKPTVKKQVKKVKKEEFGEFDESEDIDEGEEVRQKINSLDNMALDKIIELSRVKVDSSFPRREKIDVLMKQRPERLRQALILLGESSYESEEEEDY